MAQRAPAGNKGINCMHNVLCSHQQADPIIAGTTGIFFLDFLARSLFFWLESECEEPTRRCSLASSALIKSFDKLILLCFYSPNRRIFFEEDYH